MLSQCHSSGVRLHNDYFSLYTNEHADPLLEEYVADKDECYCRHRRISLNNIHFLSVFANINGLVGPSPFFRNFRHWIRPLLANSLNEQRVRVVGLVDDVLYCVCVSPCDWWLPGITCHSHWHVTLTQNRPQVYDLKRIVTFVDFLLSANSLSEYFFKDLLIQMKMFLLSVK